MLRDIRPILSALLRGRAGVMLVALQIAVTLAVIVNATYIAKQRIDKMRAPTGMDIEHVFIVSSAGFTDRFNYDATVKEDLAYLRSLSGVVAASITSTVPLSGYGAGVYLSTQPAGAGRGLVTDYIETDEQGLAALGVRLSAGRFFAPDEVVHPNSLDESVNTFPPALVVSREWAHAVFPDGPVIGQVVYAQNAPTRIVGILEHMSGAFANSDKVALGSRRTRPLDGTSYFYIVRTVPGQTDQLLRRVEQHLAASNPNRVIDWVRPLEYFKRRSDAADAALAIFLGCVTAVMLAVAALGIYGLASYHVSTRIKQIGTRRALGARRRDIVLYFMVENALINSAGILLGCLLALGIGQWLSVQNHLPRLDLYYLLGGVLALWTIGQLAVWYPGRRAASVPPAVATRTI
jgi:putative ABC transport system permease protein